MSQPVRQSMDYVIIVNGLDHAFLKEFGCDCGRCNASRRAANTSVSIVGKDVNNNKVSWHALVDVGLGVVDSLCNAIPKEQARLDWLLLTHWHPDHTLELNRFCETFRRTLKRIGESWKPIATWCRSGTAKWLKLSHRYEWKKFLDVRVYREFNPPGTVLKPVPEVSPELTITPITVSHCTADISPSKGVLPCCASFVVERKGGKKAVLLWDIDNKNDWIEKPTSDEQRKAVELMERADYLFIDCNTWSVEEVNAHSTGHVSFFQASRYARALRPKGETLLVHLSGHEDGKGNPGWGFSDNRWQQEAKKVWQDDVRVPCIGEEFSI